LTLSKRCQGPKKLATPRHRFLLRRGAALILHLALRQLLHFQQFRPRSPKRRYVGGETHLYLGRQYRLKLIKNEPEGVKLKSSFLMVSFQRQKNSRLVKRLVCAWYREKGTNRITERFHENRAALYSPWLRPADAGPAIHASPMGKVGLRWGQPKTAEH
jgi:hypothetical protein